MALHPKYHTTGWRRISGFRLIIGKGPEAFPEGAEAVGYRKFKPKFKRRVVEQWLSGEKGIGQVCREHRLADSLVRRWRQEYEERGPNAWESAARRHAELEAALGRTSMEVDFLRRALKRAGIPFPPELQW